MSVRWDKVVSQPFKAGNGGKLGGVLYPILFTLYLDELMDMLKSSGFGCYVGNVFVGTLAYANDNVLLAPYSSNVGPTFWADVVLMLYKYFVFSLMGCNDSCWWDEDCKDVLKNATVHL